jgi:hypothetical protein
MRLLDNRGQSLAELPEGNFNFEVNRLGHAIAGLKHVTQAVNSMEATDYAEQRSQAEQAGLTAEQQALVQQLRGLTDARRVEVEGESLPAELKFYLAGAVAFAGGDHGLAAEYFQKVLALPADQRPLRSTWAAYSLGRALFAMSSEAGAGPDVLAQSRQAFEQTRQLSIDGFSDPLELGVASLGEQARVARTEGDWNSAIELYATQNLQGSAVGYTSLKLLMADLSAMPDDQLAELLKGKPVQQLITASLISRLGWSFGDQPANEQKLIKLLQSSTRAHSITRIVWRRSIINRVTTPVPRPSSNTPAMAAWLGGCGPNWRCARVIKAPRLPLMRRPPRLSRRMNPGVSAERRTTTTKRSSPSVGSMAKARFWPCSAGIICRRLISFIEATTFTGSMRQQSPSVC